MFEQARIKLTAFYLLIIVAILGAFSILLLQYTAQHIRDNMEEDGDVRHLQQMFADRAIGQIEKSIAVTDAVVVVIAGILSFWLAGRTLEPIRSALDAQEQFSANASHELRTPLAVVKTDLETFLKKEHPTLDQAHSLASRSLEEVNRMNGMVENLLTLARSKKTDVPIEFEEVSVGKAVDAAVKNLARSAEAKQLSLNVKKDTGTVISGNERLLEQLFFNLIHNAITYTKEGSINIIVSVGKSVTVRITDTGIGILQKDLAHVFEPFYKADASRSMHSGGVGLGLAIVKEIVDKHNGSIHIESESGKGTTVTVTFPLWAENAS